MVTNHSRGFARARAWVMVVTLAATLSDEARCQQPRADVTDTSDAALVKLLPGFENGSATVNGVKLHYVTGGKGPPLVLLPGYPQTWWSYSKMMPPLAKRFRVIVVDIRGMGSSDKPASGYDKKTMAKDVYELMRKLGHDKVNMAGHDIGSMVAFSFAANHPDAVLKLALLDVPHPDESFAAMKLLPEEGKFGAKVDDEHPIYTWWFALHQTEGLTEKLFAGGGFKTYFEFKMNYLLENPASMTPLDRAVCIAANSTPDAVRAGSAWYRAFPRDIKDSKTYKKLDVPVLGLGAHLTGYKWLQSLDSKADNLKVVKIDKSGHFICDEQPDVVSRHLIEFFK